MAVKIAFKDRFAIASYLVQAQARYSTNPHLTCTNLCDELRESLGVTATNQTIYKIARDAGITWVTALTKSRKNLVKRNNNKNDVRLLAKALYAALLNLDSRLADFDERGPILSPERMDRLRELAERVVPKTPETDQPKQ
jgi:hypothetical protein